MTPVKLKDIVEELSFQSDEVSSLLNTKTGEVVSVADEELRAVDDDDRRDSLCNAIRGRGAFRYFKDKIHEYGIADDWYQYRDDAIREIAIGWCEENGIRYTE